MRKAFVSSAPGRLCLFGEHQDYLGLPVIAMAMNRRVTLTFNPRSEPGIRLTSEDLGHIQDFDQRLLNVESAFSPLERILAECYSWPEQKDMGGWDVWIQSEVPIQAGCSSSTALMTAWATGWTHIIRGEHQAAEIATLCHQNEVLAFHGAGGDMDQLACAHGGLHRFGTGQPVPLTPPNGTFVLADSGQPKDTQGHLRRCRDARIPLMKHINEHDVTLDAENQLLLEGTRRNRDLEKEWAKRMFEGRAEGQEMGQALTEHHKVLRDVLGLSTPRIDSILSSAIQAGAWGGKINGSGGGGCAFVLCPDSQVDEVIERMIQAGAKGAWAVSMDKGSACKS